jgi:rubrerythrin
MMTSEQDRTLKGLQVAIQMEIDGKEYYLKASRESANELGKKLLEKLAAEEDYHRQKFEQIYNAIKEKRGWPKTDFQPDGGRTLRTIFARATAEMSSGAKGLKTELDAIETAMGMENKTFDYYTRQGADASHDAEREFYHAVAREEREHYLVLLDYYEYLKDPAAWFVLKEHPSLDGG